ncbi:dihydrofolate reductase family protein [Mesorhizobium sp. CAU 1732]|uniref:dihydrofolate reductase family protein n=1 Tax=Mesorhizobium sp. CAU 1732 TaxID=3140358 RepID=UPI003260C29E
MRKIVTGAFISLDGVMQAPGGPEEDPTGGFRHGGWVPPYWDDTTGEVIGRLFSQPFDLLLGRRTYDIFAAHWPYVQMDPEAGDFEALNAGIAENFNRVTKYVATHRPDSLDWENSEALGADIPGRVRDLKQGDGRMLLTQGSTELLQILLRHDLIDELHLHVFPLLLGKGKRLFGDGAVPAALKLTSSHVSPSGVFSASYVRSGDVVSGSFAMDTPTEAELERRRTLT